MPHSVSDPQYTLFVRLRDADDPPAFDASRLSQHKSHHYRIPSRTSLHGGLASALFVAPRPLDDQQAFDAHLSVDSGQSLPQSRASLLDSEEQTTVFQSRASLLDSEEPITVCVSSVLLYIWSVPFFFFNSRDGRMLKRTKRFEVIHVESFCEYRSATPDTRRSRSFSHSLDDKSRAEGCEVTQRAPLRSRLLKSARLGLPSVGTRATYKPMSLCATRSHMYPAKSLMSDLAEYPLINAASAASESMNKVMRLPSIFSDICSTAITAPSISTIII